MEGYRFDVPNGNYEVELLFSDVFRPRERSIYLLGRDDSSVMATQGNCFSIAINGKMMAETFNPGVEADYYQAVKRRYVVSVDDGALEVSFKVVKGKNIPIGN